MSTQSLIKKNLYSTVVEVGKSREKSNTEEEETLPANEEAAVNSYFT